MFKFKIIFFARTNFSSMLFNSFEYVVFLPAVILLYFILPFRYRWIMLLGASYYFYACWKAEYLIIIIASTLIDYLCGLKMGRLDSRKKRMPYLIISLVSNLGILFFFKYFNFFSQSYTVMLENFDIFKESATFNFLLPVGISFYTFQTLSYSIDVYKGSIKPEKHAGIFALYVSFFPQLVAGPIERFDRLGPQFRVKHFFTYDNFSNGMRLILYGLFIKMVVADNLCGYVDELYDAPEKFGSSSLLTGMFFYSFQIYADFYGYSLIAVGSAKILGYTLMDNFKTPYLATGIAEFWQRWHISLSTWFRDYLFIPLGGSRVKVSRLFFNIMVVFTISGFWHGANWSFIIWGALFGLLYIIEKILNPKPVYSFTGRFPLKKIPVAIFIFILVTVIWVFFRSNDMIVVKNMFSALAENIGKRDYFYVEPFVWIFLIIFIVSDILLYNSRFDKWIGNKHLIFRWLIYFFLIFVIIVFSGVENFPFIYFQF